MTRRRRTRSGFSARSSAGPCAASATTSGCTRAANSPTCGRWVLFCSSQSYSPA